MPITRRALKGEKLTVAEGDGNWDHVDRLSPVILTISSGVITINGPGTYYLETQGAASTDDLTTILGGLGRDWEVKLRLNTNGRTVTVVNSASLALGGGNNFLLNSKKDLLVLQDNVDGDWTEVSRSGNG